MNLETAITRCSPAVAEKGKRLFTSGKVRQDPEYPDVFWVGSGTDASREYRVQVYKHFSSCSCKHGIHTGAGATCAHPLAALTYMKAKGIDLWPEAAPAPAEGLHVVRDADPDVIHLVFRTGTDDDEVLPDCPF